MKSRFAIAALIGLGFTSTASANPGTPYTGAIPPEVMEHLKSMEFWPADDYFKTTPAALVDLNGDGTPELIVDAGCTDEGICRYAIYQKKGPAYQVIGEQACDKAGFSVEKGKDKWMTFVCGDGKKTSYDNGKHRYGSFRGTKKK